MVVAKSDKDWAKKRWLKLSEAGAMYRRGKKEDQAQAKAMFEGLVEKLKEYAAPPAGASGPQAAQGTRPQAGTAPPKGPAGPGASTGA